MRVNSAKLLVQYKKRDISPPGRSHKVFLTELVSPSRLEASLKARRALKVWLLIRRQETTQSSLPFVNLYAFLILV
jgi:hypothetical protein